LAAALSGKVDSYKDADVRRALAPLAKLAADLKVVVWPIRHLVKRGGPKAINSGCGSIGIGAAARSLMVIDIDPQDETEQRRILASVKVNVAQRSHSISFTIDSVPVTYKDKLVEDVPRIRWLGPSPLSANDLAKARSLNPHPRRRDPHRSGRALTRRMVVGR
jgi:hypothetical protein